MRFNTLEDLLANQRATLLPSVLDFVAEVTKAWVAEGIVLSHYMSPEVPIEDSHFAEGLCAHTSQSAEMTGHGSGAINIEIELSDQLERDTVNVTISIFGIDLGGNDGIESMLLQVRFTEGAEGRPRWNTEVISEEAEWTRLDYAGLMPLLAEAEGQPAEGREAALSNATGMGRLWKRLQEQTPT